MKKKNLKAKNENAKKKVARTAAKSAMKSAKKSKTGKATQKSATTAKGASKVAKAKGSLLVKAGYLVPGLPHLLLQKEKNAGWTQLAESMQQLSQRIAELNPDVLLIYSTYWPSVIGHQVQARENAKWVHVDELFHSMGSIPYDLRMDKKFAEEYTATGNSRGLHMRTIDYHGFPIDTGSVVTLKMLNPGNKIPAIIVSSNIYADRAETVVLGKAAYESLAKQNKTAVAIVVSSLSNRVLPLDFDPADDQIYSKKDEEWNRKILEYLELGRLEDVSQLSRQVHREARVQKVNNFKPFWWLSAVMGQHNKYKGSILAYAPVQGTGAAVVELIPTDKAARDLEYDEEDPQVFLGERNVLERSL